MNRKHFEKDDFADDKDIQRQRRLIAEREEMVGNCIKIVTSKLSLDEGGGKDLSAFELYTSLGDPDVTNTFHSSRKDLPLRVFFIEHTWQHRNGRYYSSGENLVLFGLLRLNKEYPLTYIYKETIREKIVDWFVKGDVDIPGEKKFSRFFHVVTKNKEQLLLLLNKKPLDELTAFPGMQIEINGYDCLFRVSDMEIDKVQAEKFASLAETLCRMKF